MTLGAFFCRAEAELRVTRCFLVYQYIAFKSQIYGYLLVRVQFYLISHFWQYPPFNNPTTIMLLSAENFTIFTRERIHNESLLILRMW